MHGYVVPSRIGTLACTTLQLEFSVYSGKNDVKKYVKNLELINKDKKKNKKLLDTRYVLEDTLCRSRSRRPLTPALLQK